MKVRNIIESDLPRAKELLDKQSIEYEFPSLGEFIETVAVEVDGKVIMAVAARETVELYMICDSEYGTPALRNEALKLIHDEMGKRLVARKIKDAHVWIPPKLARAFGRRLTKKFMWVQSHWPCFTRVTG